MTFDTSKLEALPDAAGAIRKDPTLTLILIKGSGQITQDHTASGKDAMMGQYDEATDVLLVAWTGKWRTQVFKVNDVMRRYQ